MAGLSVRGLTVRRGRRAVLEYVSFSASAGTLTAVLGASGSGKTTLLAAIAGLLPLERGAVLRDGADLARLSARRRGVGLLPPGSALPPGRDVGASLKRLATRRVRGHVPNLLAALRLEGGTRVAEQTHCEAALALAAARLLPEGDVLLVDEAGEGLAAAARDHLLSVLRGVAEGGRAVVLATRQAEVARCADHLVLLHGGCAIQAGTPASLYAEPHDAAAALLTGPANIFVGRIREIRGTNVIWANGGRFVQAADPGTARPVLGAEVMLCLRPERLALLLPGDAADNVLEGEIFDVRPAGALLDVRAMTALGELRVLAPSFAPRFYPAPGQVARFGWAAAAGWVLP